MRWIFTSVTVLASLGMASAALAAGCGCDGQYSTYDGGACCCPNGYSLAPGCCECQPTGCDNAWAGYCEHRAKMRAFWSCVGAPKPEKHWGFARPCSVVTEPVYGAPADADLTLPMAEPVPPPQAETPLEPIPEPMPQPAPQRKPSVVPTPPVKPTPPASPTPQVEPTPSAVPAPDLTPAEPALQPPATRPPVAEPPVAQPDSTTLELSPLPPVDKVAPRPTSNTRTALSENPPAVPWNYRYPVSRY